MGRRVAAHLVDVAIIAAPSIALISRDFEYVKQSSFDDAADFCEELTNAAEDTACVPSPVPDDRAYFAEDFPGAGAWAGWGLGLALALLIFVVLQGLTGRTPGKFVFGTRTVRPDGGPPGVGRALVRTLLWVVDGLCFYLVGFIVALTTNGHRRIGDMAAKTFVVRSADAGRPIVVPGMAPPPVAGYAYPGAPQQPWGGVPGSPPGSEAPWGTPPPYPGAPPGPAPSPGAPEAPKVVPGVGVSEPSAPTATSAWPPQDTSTWQPSDTPADLGGRSSRDKPAGSTPDTLVSEPGETPTGPGAEIPGDAPGDTAEAPSGESVGAASEPPSDRAIPEPGETPTGPPPGTGGGERATPGGEGEPPPVGSDASIAAGAIAEDAEAQPAVGASGTAAPGAEATGQPGYNPQWDPARGTYILWDAQRGSWLAWDNTAQEWKAI